MSLATAAAMVMLLAGAEEAGPKTPIQRMEPAQRAKVLAALAALVMLGFLLVFLAWLGAKATRRYMNREPNLIEKPPPATPVREKDWADKPLAGPYDEDERDA
jgi:hypothetical protein